MEHCQVVTEVLEYFVVSHDCPDFVARLIFSTLLCHCTHHVFLVK